MLDILLTLILFLFSILAPGLAITNLFFSFPRYLALLVAYGLGTALLSGELFFYFFILRLAISSWLYIYIFLQATTALLLYIKKHKKISPIRFFETFLKSIKINEWLLISLIFLIVIFSGLQAITKPPIHHDAMSVWSLRAKILERDGQVNFNPDNYYYLGSPYVISYPWHSSLVEYWLRQLGTKETMVNLLPWGYFISIVFLLFYILRQRLNRLKSLVFILFFVSMPLIFLHSFNTYVDLVLAFYVLLAIFFLLEWLRYRKQSFLYFSAVCIGWTFFIKNEGIFFVAAWLLALLFDSYIYQLSFLRKKIWYILACIILSISGWLIFKQMYHLEINDSFILGWHPEIFTSFFYTLFIFNNWNIWWFIFFILLALFGKKIWINKNNRPFWVFFSVALFCFGLLYVATQSFEYAANFTAIARTTIPFIPLSIIAASLLLSDDNTKVKEN